MVSVELAFFIVLMTFLSFEWLSYFQNKAFYIDINSNRAKEQTIEHYILLKTIEYKLDKIQ